MAGALQRVEQRRDAVERRQRAARRGAKEPLLVRRQPGEPGAVDVRQQAADDRVVAQPE
jgi:hypothetical protein